MEKQTQHSQYKNLYEVQHPLLAHKLALLRDANTQKKEFKELIHEVTLLLGYAATQHLPLKTVSIKTPFEETTVEKLADEKPIILPILRAGLGMVDAMLSLMPQARVGHIGMYREEPSHQPKQYYFKLPQGSQNHPFFIVDPMLATGNSAIAAIDKLKTEGIKNMTLLCIFAAPEGIQNMLQHHPDVPIYASKLDRELNENAYIVPGVGDAGDRMFGTMLEK